MKQVTKEMIEAGHAVLLNVLLETGHIAMSASLLERIYLSMEQASPQPQRAWQGLMDEERKSIWSADQMTPEEWDELFDTVEAKLKEKNT
jgi:hypothetical protein